MKPRDGTTIISPAKEAALLVIPNKGKLPNSLSSSRRFCGGQFHFPPKIVIKIPNRKVKECLKIKSKLPVISSTTMSTFSVFEMQE